MRFVFVVEELGKVEYLLAFPFLNRSWFLRFLPLRSAATVELTLRVTFIVTNFTKELGPAMARMGTQQA